MPPVDASSSAPSRRLKGRVTPMMPMTTAPSSRAQADRSSPSGLLDFVLPPHLEAGEPPEARGLARDEVRLLVSSRGGSSVVHTTFRELPGYLDAGDLVVI